MKKNILRIIILLLLVGCQSKSDCFGGRVIFEEVEIVVKYENSKELLFKEKEGKSYIACKVPDSLTNNQNYKAVFKLLETKSNEKWVGQPCEIVTLEVVKKQLFEALAVNQRTVFSGSSNKTKNGETITHGIYVTKVSETKISYEFTELINWKHSRKIIGNAILKNTPNDLLETKNNQVESAFRFVDSKNAIEIFITKDFKLNETRSRLIEKSTSKSSCLMYNK